MSGFHGLRCCNTYNHQNYIRDALEGFLAQKTNFSFEVLVHDDASEDKTVEIIKEYSERFPNIIKPLFQKENQFSMRVGYTLSFLLLPLSEPAFGTPARARVAKTYQQLAVPR